MRELLVSLLKEYSTSCRLIVIPKLTTRAYIYYVSRSNESICPHDIIVDLHSKCKCIEYSEKYILSSYTYINSFYMDRRFKY